MDIALNLDRRYSYADYLTWLDEKRRELIDGFIRLIDSPTLLHEDVKVNIVSLLKWHTKEHKNKCKVFAAPIDVRLPKNGETADKDIYTVVQPDICVVCDPEKLKDPRSCLGAPDLVVEILSPASMRYDWRDKFVLYERSGVREYWIVSPKDHSVNVFILQADGKYDEGKLYEDGAEGVPVHIFEGLMLKWNDIFEQ